MQLNKVQARFKDVMLDHPDVVANPPEDLESVFASGDIALSDRLKVYRNNIVGSLTDVMVAQFPALEKLVGEDFLKGMARSFALENPPSHGCLNIYGAGFAEFIEGFGPAQSLPYLPDVARLEIAMNHAYYGADDTPLTQDALATIQPEDLGDIVLKLRDNVQLLKLSYAAHDIQRFAFDDTGDAPNMERGDVFLMVHRPTLESQIVMLDEAEFHLLQALDAGTPLGGAVEAIMAQFQTFNFQAFLEKHLALETFLTIGSNVISDT